MSEGRRFSRSYSQLSGYTRCGEAFRISRIVRPRPPFRPAAWLAVGTAVHGVYQDWENHGRDPEWSMPSKFEERYEQEIASLKERQPDLSLWLKTPRVKSVENDIKLRGEHGLKQVEVYQEHCETAEWRLWELPDETPAVEVGFEIELGGVAVKGFIDAILEWPDGRITIRDLKTGNKQDNLFQHGLYTVAANEMFGLDIQFAETWYTKTGDTPGWVDTKRITKEFLADQFGRLDKGIDDRIFLANPGDHCGMCDVKPYCRLKGWLKDGDPWPASTVDEAADE